MSVHSDTSPVKRAEGPGAAGAPAWGVAFSRRCEQLRIDSLWQRLPTALPALAKGPGTVRASRAWMHGVSQQPSLVAAAHAAVCAGEGELKGERPSWPTDLPLLGCGLWETGSQLLRCLGTRGD